MITFLSKILLKSVLPTQGFVRIIIGLVIINSITIILFLSAIDYAFTLISWETLSQIALLMLELVLFDFAILGLIYANNSTVLLLFSGTISLIAGDFFITYSYISQTIHLFFYGQLLWLLGLFLIMFSVLSIYVNQHYSIKDWFRKSNAIRSKLAFWSFSVSISSFLIFFVIAYVFSVISKQVFISLPLLFLIYSIIVVISSVFIGKSFEIPFKKIENNIRNMLITDNRNNIDNNFSIEEFIFLQKYITDTFSMQKEFADIAGKAAHDLGSPLISINSAIGNIKHNREIITNLPALELALTEVKEITNNLLSQYRSLTASNPKLVIDTEIEKPRYINLVKLIDNVLVSKNIEWQEKPCHIKMEAKIENHLYFVSPMKLLRVLSNLLNNAYESLTSDNRNIIICLSEDNKYFTLSIKDTGIGIAKEKIKDVLSGASSKHTGKGLGISSALEYANLLGGNLSIDSEPNNGTTVTLQFLINPYPAWLATKISYTSKSKFVILDNDPAIHMNLQLKLQSFGIKSYHYVDIDSYSKFISNFDNNSQNIIYLIDLNLNIPNLDGFEIIKKFNLLDNQNVYLITSDAEDLDVQNRIQEYKIKLVHKSILNSIQFTLLKSF